MPAAHRRWTAREVRQLIAESPLATPRYELVDGELLVTPSPSGLHQNAVGVLAALLRDYLRTERVGQVFASPLDVELESGLIVQPDLLVVPIAEARRLLSREHAPARELLLAVEVLSPSSSRFDRVVKKPSYQRHVPEYWIVDLDARLVERWKPNDERPAIFTQSLEWHPAGATELFRLNVVRYFDEVFELLESGEE